MIDIATVAFIAQSRRGLMETVGGLPLSFIHSTLTMFKQEILLKGKEVAESDEEWFHLPWY